jgi:ATP-dependent helicase YprA (DUF1998 family)
MDVFKLRNNVIEDYSSYVRSFLTIKDEGIASLVQEEMDGGFLWPAPLIQLNPSFEIGETLRELIDAGELHPECINIFRDKKDDGTVGAPFRLHRHQVEGIRAARAGESYVLTTGTGSGKSLSYIVPIVDHVLRRGSGKGIQAIIVYPMNALANSQMGELEKFLNRGYPAGCSPVTYRRYTGQESDEERKAIIASPPDILLTNYVMLELVLTKPWDHQLIDAAKGLRFLVLDELHTYRGRQGADVAMLVRRVREACDATNLLHVGTSATLSSGGSWMDQQEEVAAMATRLFGHPVKPASIIGETLRRSTAEHRSDDEAFIAKLKVRLESGVVPATGDTTAFLEDPLSSWIESALGLQTEKGTGWLVRCEPRSLSGDEGVALRLSRLTGVEQSVCEEQLRRALLAGYRCRDENGHPVFAFRLHQFVSKGESVYASPEPDTTRHVTLQAQQYVPGSSRTKVLLPLAFCRECGQEYYTVRKGETDDGQAAYLPRAVSDRLDDDEGEAGFLYLSADSPWPDDAEEFIPKLPDSWLDSKDGTPIVARSQRKNLPQKVYIDTAGVEGAGSQVAWWLKAPFRFCLECGIAYGAHQQSDFGKLATLGSEGRSTATTVMTLSTIRQLRSDESLVPTARKLLSFTDNRQDASLQAGHFNDFVEIALLRSAIWKAVDRAGEEGLRHDKLTLRAFEALNLPLKLYAADPSVKYAAREETDRALREVLGYYLYRRLTIPGLVHEVLEPRNDADVAGYQLNAAAMVWRRGAGTSGFHDPIRVPRKPKDGLRTNPFFTSLYQGSSEDLKNLEAREHTAQVSGEVREEREKRFRAARLPILYCSPTMELGVDISQLNVVNMRNVPPTPANYAQRSGRAGRSGWWRAQ